MFCSKCGTQLSDDALFCFKCGEKTVNESTPDISNQQKRTSISTPNENTAKIKEFLTYAKTLETNCYTMNKAIIGLQTQINQLGYTREFQKAESKRGDFAKPFILVFLILVALVLVIFFAIPSLSAHFNPIILIMIAIISALPIAFIIAKITSLLLFAKRDKAYKKLVENDKIRVENEIKQIISLKEQQNDFRNKIKETEVLLDKLYKSNVIYPKYRGFVPILTIWEYFDSGRCFQLDGPDGAYNLYESESRQNIIISNLNQIISMLDQIKKVQYAIYEAVETANYLAERICRQNEQLIASNEVIQKNAEITAYNSKIAADNSSISAYIDVFTY